MERMTKQGTIEILFALFDDMLIEGVEQINEVKRTRNGIKVVANDGRQVFTITAAVTSTAR